MSVRERAHRQSQSVLETAKDVLSGKGKKGKGRGGYSFPFERHKVKAGPLHYYRVNGGARPDHRGGRRGGPKGVSQQKKSVA